MAVMAVQHADRLDKLRGQKGRRLALDLSPNALKVLRARYLKKDADGKVVETPEELFWRVAWTVALPEADYPEGSPDAVLQWARAFYDFIASGAFMPNSPTLMNAGREMGMLSACFVLPVEDSIDGIFSSIKHTALIQKAGGGTGFDFSRLRPTGDRVLSSGGTTSGPLSFLRVFSAATDSIQQGAFRRGANMGMMRIDHPDIVGFITAKDDLSRFTNYNFSVSITDAFMTALRENPEAPHLVVNPRTAEASQLPKDGGTKACWTVGEIWDLIVTRAHATGEPGVVFIDRINDKQPTPHVGRIEATNPCGEQPLLPFEACNLGSINVARFVRSRGAGDGMQELDWEGFREAVRNGVRFLDNVIDANRYPLPEIDAVCKANRKIGLGVMGLADALFRLQIPYDSDEGLAFGSELARVLQEEAHAESERLAAVRGVFPNWKGSRWDTEWGGRKVRNACVTTIAPTGTISILANCSSGIEPLFSVAFFRNVLNGQRLAEVNEIFVGVAKEQGFYTDTLMERIAEQGSVRRFAEIPEDVRRVFGVAMDIAPEWHVRMQAAFQEHNDASISKTINFPHDASVDHVRHIYDLAFRLGCKGVTLYRDGCRKNQPMDRKHRVKKEEPDAGEKQAAVHRTGDPIVPISLPGIMPCVRVRQLTPFGNMHVKISVEGETGTEREVFAQLGKGGDLANSDLEAICRMLSLFLRCGGALELAIQQLEGIGSSLSVPSRDGRIRSLADGVSKALRRFLRAKQKFGHRAILLGEVTTEMMDEAFLGANGTPGPPGTPNGHSPAEADFKVRCPDCGSVLAFEEGCVKCHGCGFSQC